MPPVSLPFKPYGPTSAFAVPMSKPPRVVTRIMILIQRLPPSGEQPSVAERYETGECGLKYGDREAFPEPALCAAFIVSRRLMAPDGAPQCPALRVLNRDLCRRKD